MVYFLYIYSRKKRIMKKTKKTQNKGGLKPNGLPNKKLDLKVLALIKGHNQLALKQKIQALLGSSFQIIIHKTLLNNAFEIKVIAKDYYKKNNQLLRKMYTLVLNKLRDSGIQIKNAQPIYLIN